MSDVVVAGDESHEAPVKAPTTADDGSGTLRPRLGTTAVVLTVIAYLAPLAAAAGYIPLVIGYGNGLGAPMIFLLCGVVLTVFSFGYLAMVRQVPRPGAFYAYISAGLGKRVGLGAGVLTLTFNPMSAIGIFIFGGLSMSSLVRAGFGVDLPWWVYVTGLAAIVGFCSYRGVNFNVRVLGVVVAIEITIIMLFNVMALVRGGPTGYSTEPFTWSAFTSGPIAVAALFAIAFFVGFESTAIYREEVHNPSRTIRRATYSVIAVISIFYAVTAYCLITILGTDKVVEASAADPAGAFNTAFTSVLGHTLSQVVAIMVVTSVVASVLAIVNAATRYVYSFGVDGVLPQALGAVHKRYGSPHRAALATNAVIIAVAILIALSGTNPQKAYGIFSGVMVFGFETLMLLVSAAVIVYFRRNRSTGESLWSRLIAPALSIVFVGWLFYFSVIYVDLLVGETTPLTRTLFGLLLLAFVVGFGYASWLAVRRPEVFARIGRAQT